MFEVAAGAINAAVLIYNQIQTTKHNKDEVKLLGERLAQLSTLLKSAEKNKGALSKPDLNSMLQDCTSAGNDCAKTLNEFASKSKSSLFFSASKYKAQFDTLNLRLDRSIAYFTAALTADSHQKLTQIEQDAAQKQKMMQEQQKQNRQIAATNFANQQTLAQMQQAAQIQQQMAATQMLFQQELMLKRLAALEQTRTAPSASSSSSSSSSSIITVTTMNYEGMSHMQTISTACYLSNGLVASGSKDRTVKLWDPNKGYAVDTLRDHTSAVTGITEIYKNGISTGLAASVSFDEKVKIWSIDMPSGEEERTRKTLRGHKGAVLCVADLGNGKIATGSTDKTIRIWDTEIDEDDAEIIKLKGHTNDVIALVAMSDDILVSASSDSTLKVWSIDWSNNTAEELYSLEIDTKRLMTVCKVSDTTFASAAVEGKIQLWNLKTGKELASYKEEHIGLFSLASMGPGSNKLAFGDSKGRINLVDISNNTMKKTKIMTHADNESIFSLAKGHTANTILSAAKDMKLKLFNIETGTEILTFTGTKAEALAKNAAPATQATYTPGKTATAGKISPTPSTNTSEQGSPEKKNQLSLA